MCRKLFWGDIREKDMLKLLDFDISYNMSGFFFQLIS